MQIYLYYYATLHRLTFANGVVEYKGYKNKFS